MLILRGPQNPVDALVFSPDAATLYAVNYDGVRAWNLAEHTVVPLMATANEQVYGPFVIHPAGRWAFGWCPTAPSTMPVHNPSRVIDLQTGQTLPFNFLNMHHNQSVALLFGTNHFVTIGHSAQEQTRQVVHLCYRLYGWTMTPTGPEYVWHYDIPDSEYCSRCVILDEHRFATADRGRITIRSLANGSPIGQIPFSGESVNQLLASSDGRQVVARHGTSFWVWDTNEPSRPPVIVAGKEKHWMTAQAAAFHPSGKYFLLANDGKSVIAYDTNTWQPARKWNWKADTLRTVGVSPDGTLAAASGPSGTIVVWDWDL